MSVKIMKDPVKIGRIKREKITVIYTGCRAGKNNEAIEYIRNLKQKVYEHRDISRFCKIDVK